MINNANLLLVQGYRVDADAHRICNFQSSVHSLNTSHSSKWIGCRADASGFLLSVSISDLVLEFLVLFEELLIVTFVSPDIALHLGFMYYVRLLFVVSHTDHGCQTNA